MVFQEATSEPAGKAKKPRAWHLIPHNKHLGKQGCSCWFHNHKMFNPHKTQDGHHSAFGIVYVQCISLCCQFICCCLSVVIRLCQLLWFTFIHFCLIISNSVSVLFNLLSSTIQCTRLFSSTFCSDTGLVFQVFWSPYQQPSSKSINIIHKTPPSFVLV
jgi:hypothetical protein